MTPNEIQEVASTAQMVGLPSWSNLVALLVGALGAFLGAYLSQKARDRATNENFAEVLKQLRKSTHDTEQIKSAISSKGWIDQQAWSQKRQIYSDVLLHLTKLSGLLSRCSAQFDPPQGAEDDTTIPEKSYYIEWSKKIAAAFSELEELMGGCVNLLATRLHSEDRVSSIHAPQCRMVVHV